MCTPSSLYKSLILTLERSHFFGILMVYEARVAGLEIMFGHHGAFVPNFRGQFRQSLRVVCAYEAVGTEAGFLTSSKLFSWYIEVI